MEQRIFRIAVPVLAVFAVQPQGSAEYPSVFDELMVEGLLANIGIGLVLPIRSSSLATGFPVPMCTGTDPGAPGVVE